MFVDTEVRESAVPPVLVHSADGLNFFGGQIEVEDIDVRYNPLFGGALLYDNHTSLCLPLDADGGRCHVILGRQILDQRYVQRRSCVLLLGCAGSSQR